MNLLSVESLQLVVRHCLHMNLPDRFDIYNTWLIFLQTTCTDIIIPMGRDRDNTMFPVAPFNLESTTQFCRAVFYDTITPGPHWILTKFGGRDIKLVLKKFGSNIIFSNGGRDPYSSGGVLHNISHSVVVVYSAQGTPLWRNGPPEKPVLCNACGSRWRTKGTLINYTPLHCRAEPDDFVEYKVPRVKLISIKNKEPKLVKRKQSHEHVVFGEASTYDQNYRRSLEEDTSNRSSSGLAISYSESCAQYGGTVASDLTGSAQSVVWDSLVPSRKRTCVSRPKTSSVEKLTKDLYSILHEQQSYFSGSSEEDLLFDGEAPMVSVEIGHGSILMKHPNFVALEEESEASSFTIDNKSNSLNEVYSGSTSFPVHTDSKSFGSDEIKKPVGQGTQQKGDKSYEMSEVLRNSSSPLRSTDLKDVVSFEEFVNHFTHDEQLQLMKYLRAVDTVRLLDMFVPMQI